MTDEIEKLMSGVRDHIVEMWAKEASISINDPNFWEKYNKFVSERPSEDFYEDDEDRFCPYCGKELDD